MINNQMGSATRVPRELEIVLNGPIGPQRFRDDTMIIDEDGWYRMITPSATFPAANEIFFSNLDPLETDRQIEAMIAGYHQSGLPLSWCVYPWSQPGDLGERLLARGGTATNVRAYLVNTALALEVVDGVAVERVDPASPAAIDDYLALLSAGYGLPADEEAFRRRRYRELCAGPNPVMILFIARCHGTIAGCAGMIIKAASAHLTTASVLPAFQGRGVFQSLTAIQLATLRDLNIAIASGHANEQSAFWIERFGFRFIYPYVIYDLYPPSSAG